MNDITLIENEKGATLVETAIIIMLLLIFIFGIIEIGLLLFNKQVLTDASRRGARAGIVVALDRSDPVDAHYYVTVKNDKAFEWCTQYLVTFGSGIPYMDPAAWDYQELMDPPGPSRGDDLQVSLRYDYDFLFLSVFGIGPVTLRADTIMKFE